MGNRKHTLAMTVAVGLVSAGQYELAAGLAALYLVVNTVLHLAGKDALGEE